MIANDNTTPGPSPSGRGSRVCLGKIATAHGIRGAVKLTVYAEDPHTIDQYGPVYTSASGNDTLTLSLYKPMNNFWLAEVEGITDRTAAEALRGTELWLDRDRLPAIDNPNQYYIADLIGMKAVNEAGKEIGIITAVHNFGAGDLLEITPLGGEDFYLPFTIETALQVDIKGRSLTVRIPEGLL